MNTAGSYLALTKPRLLPLVLFSGFPAFVMATGGWPRWDRTLIVLGATALAAGAANILNSYLERDRDARMVRTQTRPLPSGEIKPAHALTFGLVLAFVSTGALWVSVGSAAAYTALAAILVYVFVYTLWLKPRTPFGVIVGGFSGAVAPLIADAAVDGMIGPAGWALFSIIFVWQPPHFWAIGLYRAPEYAAAGFPLLTDQIGEDATRQRILAWIVALIPITLLPTALGLVGLGYCAAALGLGGWFAFSAVRLIREKTDAAARNVFRVSLIYLLGLFVAMIVDLAWRTA